MIELMGKLIGWQDGPLHVGLSLDDPTYAEGYDDWAALSGQRVRVTVDLVPEPEPRCPFCGGEIEETPFYHFDGDRMYAVSQTAKCLQCGAHGEGKTRQAALDALAEWLDKCPRCGGKAEYVQFMSVGRILAKCACGLQSPVFTDKPKTAQWWNKRAP